MHKYVPRVHVCEICAPAVPGAEQFTQHIQLGAFSSEALVAAFASGALQCVRTVSFTEAQFVAVTAYQNNLVILFSYFSFHLHSIRVFYSYKGWGTMYKCLNE